MSTAALNSNEAAEQLGISPSTLKNWAVRLPVPSWVDGGGTRRFPPEALEVLETVKKLRDEERSYATIRRVIAPEAPAPVDEPNARPAPSEARVAEIMGVLRPLWNALQTELATAARRITRLEAKVDELRAEKVALIAELDAIQVRLQRLEEGRAPVPGSWRLFRR